jgi:hypothetical protein
MDETRPSDSELRKRWRLMWLQCVQEMSDLDQQKTFWLDPTNTNPHWSFVEYSCGYFDDCWLSDHDGGYQRKLAQGWMNDEEIAAVREWHRLFKTYRPPGGDDYNDKAILEDPKWLEVVRLAGEARQCLARILSDEQELRAL